jgi:hypothetical protein
MFCSDGSWKRLDGISPLNKLLLISIELSLGFFISMIRPFIRLLCRNSDEIPVRYPSDSGKFPESKLIDRSRNTRFETLPTVEGMLPVSEFILSEKYMQL